MSHAIALPCFNTLSSAKLQPRQIPKKAKQSRTSVGFGADKKDPLWQCVEACGACCKLAKGPAFATPEEIFKDPAHVELYRSMIGPDGWCIHYEKSTRKCSIYSDRPYFCRVEPDVFKSLYGIDKKKFNKEACRYWTGLIPSGTEKGFERGMYMQKALKLAVSSTVTEYH